MNKTEEMTENNEQKIDFPLKQIYYYLTEGCNLACRHCWLSPKLQSEDIVYPSLEGELFESIVEQAVPLGVTAVKLTGGEPLMHPNIMEILRTIKKHDLQLCIETNGVLCSAALAEEIASFKSKFVSVSLDGADAETHEWMRGIKGCFNAAVNGARNLSKAGIKTQIIFTVTRYNKDQLEDLVRLAESLGASSVKFNIVQPTGRGEKLSSEGENLPVEELLELGQWVDNILSSSTKLKLYFDFPPAFRKMSKMFGRDGDGCASCGILEILGVLSNGCYALCGIGSHVPELVFGDAKSDRLDDVWKNNKILQELREGIPSRFKGICGSCLMKRMCSASCIAQNYYRSKSLWSCFWFCDEAYARGFFPASRISTKSILKEK